MKSTYARSIVKSLLPAEVMRLAYRWKYRGQRLPNADRYVAALRGSRAIEVGGPSTLFSYILPVYPVLGSLDGVNFGNATLWEGRISEGRAFRYHLNRRGTQYICEATDLAVESSSYDCVLSSNCLEHVANPLKALAEWVRVIRPGGHLLLVLPNKESNFDHLRPVTTFKHTLEDLERNVTEDDLTHLDEILRLHDLSLDPRAGSAEQFAARCRHNFRHRALHHHVFDLQLVEQMLRHVGVRVVERDMSRTDLFTLGVVSK